MLVMLAVAAMSLPFMAILAAMITVEKVIVRGATWFNYALGFGFVVLAVAVFLAPNLLISV